MTRTRIVLLLAVFSGVVCVVAPFVGMKALRRSWA